MRNSRARALDRPSLCRGAARWRRVTVAAAVSSVVTLTAAHAVPTTDWFINEDYKQLDARAASDFDILVRGDIRGRINGGGTTATTNPFAGPTLGKSLSGGNTVLSFSGTNTIARSTTSNRHFGFYGSGPKPTVISKAWSYPTTPNRMAVPFTSFSYQYDPGTGALTFTVANTSSDTVTMQDVGFMTTSTEIPIDSLNRNTLPPSAFAPIASLDHAYSPGQSDSFVLTGVAATDFETTYGTASYSGSSSGNPYDGTGGEWSEVRVAANLIPEPATLAVLAPALLLACRGRSRAPGLVTRKGRI